MGSKDRSGTFGSSDAPVPGATRMQLWRVLALLAAVWAFAGKAEGEEARQRDDSLAPAQMERPVEVADLSQEEDVSAGKDFREWLSNRGWKAAFGAPEFFFIRQGALHLVSKPGPIWRKRAYLWLTNRKKVRSGVENAVMLQLAGGEDFRVDVETLATLRFRMTPIVLPGKGADLRHPSKGDCAFYLLVGFDTERYDCDGIEMPKTVGYVWANHPWEEPVGMSTRFPKSIRYIPIGWGEEELGKPQETVRNVKEDFRLAFPEDEGKAVPDVIEVSLMIDSNSVDSEAESALDFVRFESQGLQRQN